MKFCKHCGNQRADDAVCNCPGAVAERSQQGGYQQGGYQQGGYQGGYQQGGYQQGGYQGGPQYVTRSGKSFGQKLIEPFTIYFKNPKLAVDNRIKEKDFVTPIIYIAVLFLVMLGVKNCIYGHVAYEGRPLIDYNFGFALLAAFIAVIAMCTVYVMSRFLILLVCGRKPANAGQLFVDSFISFGVNSIVPMGIILIGGLFYLASSLVASMFFAVAVVWYICAGLLEIKDEFDPNGNVFVRLLMAGLIIGVFVALYFLLYRGLYEMNVRTISASAYYFRY